MFRRARILWSDVMMLWRTITLTLLNVNLRALGTVKHTLLGRSLFPSSTQEVGPIQTQNLRQIRSIAEEGFGDPHNRYAFTMEAFKGRIFVGTSNILHPIPGIYQFGLGKPLSSHGAQIWAMNPLTDQWTQLVQGGLHNQSNFAIRKLYACENFMVAATVNHELGLEIWGTLDGLRWSVLARGGFGNRHNTSGRGIIAFHDKLYFTTENRAQGAELWRCSREDLLSALCSKRPEERLRDCWDCVAVQGLGNDRNVWFSDLVVFQDLLWLGTMNNSCGFSLFSSHNGDQFRRVTQNGHTTRNNHAVMRLVVFKGELYLSTMNWIQGFSIFVVRTTGDGNACLDEVLSKGFASVYNAYVWQMCVFEDRLYAGTFQNSFLGLRLGMFSLLSSDNGRDWVVETDSAFGPRWTWWMSPQLGDYGVRSMLVFQDRLYLGTATAHNSCKIYQAESLLQKSSGSWKVTVSEDVAPPLVVPGTTVEHDAANFTVPLFDTSLISTVQT